MHGFGLFWMDHPACICNQIFRMAFYFDLLTLKKSTTIAALFSNEPPPDC